MKEIPSEFLSVTGKVKRISYPEQGCTSEVAILEAEQGSFVVKKAVKPRYIQWLEREAKVLASLKDTNLPVPYFYSFVKKQTEAYILMEYIQGETLGDALQKETNIQKREQLIYQFGKILAFIHETPCPPSIKTEQLWLDYILERARIDLQQFPLDGTEDLLNQLKQHRPKAIQQTLIHGDFTVDNVLVRNGEIVGVIDWSGGAYGDPRYDLSLAIWPKEDVFAEERNINLFFEGYGTQNLDEETYHYFANGIYEFL